MIILITEQGLRSTIVFNLKGSTYLEYTGIFEVEWINTSTLKLYICQICILIRLGQVPRQKSDRTE